MSYRGDSAFLNDILRAIRQLNKYSDRSFEDFRDNELIRVWILYHVQLIGEASSRLFQELRDKHPQIPWQAIIAMRNVLVHAYFSTKLERVWDTVQKEVPQLEGQVAEIIARGDVE